MFVFRQAGIVFPALAVLAAANGTPKEVLTPLIDRSQAIELAATLLKSAGTTNP